MTKKIKELSKDLQYEYTVDNMVNKVDVKKGTLCMTIKLLSSKNVIENEYYIPAKTSEIKIPITTVYITNDMSNTKRENYIRCRLQREENSDGQVFITYIIDTSDLDEVRNSLS